VVSVAEGGVSVAEGGGGNATMLTVGRAECDDVYSRSPALG
jgi:hypothetical protein